MSHRTTRIVASALAAVLLLGACSGGDDDPSAAPAPEASEGDGAKVVEVSPVTGKPFQNGRPDHPVFVVKVENTDAGAPQIGLDQADLVVEELVEGGITRLAAMYYSTLPKTVGHVRSLRGTDIGIAKPVGGQIVASGGAIKSLVQVRGAKVVAHTEDAGASGFRSDPAKSRPYNRLVDLQTLASTAPDSAAPGPYFDWTPAGAEDEGPERTPASRASVRFSPSSTTTWTLRDGTWIRTNGHATKEFRANNLVVMFADVVDAGYLDPSGSRVPETKVKGKGRAVILTADGAVEGTWTKPGVSDTVTFKTKDGAPVTIKPGKTWIELVPNDGGTVTYN